MIGVSRTRNVAACIIALSLPRKFSLSVISGSENITHLSSYFALIPFMGFGHTTRCLTDTSFATSHPADLLSFSPELMPSFLFPAILFVQVGDFLLPEKKDFYSIC